MSVITENAVVTPRPRVRADDAPTTPADAVPLGAWARTGALVAVAGWLGYRWWTSVDLVPISWRPPAAGALFLLPAAVVVGLLALRLVVGGRDGSDLAQHLTTQAIRWAGVTAGVTAGWLVLTGAGLYGGLDRLLGAGNQLAVLGADGAAKSQLALFQVALLVALFGSRLGGRRESAGLLVLVGMALLAAFPFAGGAHGHGVAEPSPLLPGLAGLQVLAVAVWLGALVSLPSLQRHAVRLRHRLTRFGDLVSVTALVTGVTAVIAGLLYPGYPTAPVLAVGQLAVLGLVLAVGRQQRQRIVDVVSARRGIALVALGGGEVVVMVAVVLVACWVPTGA